ncbi:hypothetical protein [uncultured Desulfobacter sp.]|uniref:hypothetical protein n=1 Tax=uncultured Desulfobacter sp. TaxID=240139 RepID=UPI002AAC40E7|nr:hypothetical protein [uncultured Desulfobacter sp.]
MYSELIAGLGVIASIVTAYHTAKFVFNSEIKKSKSLLMSACLRFYCASAGCVENGVIRSDNIARDIYISELKDIKRIIESFLGTQYYSEYYLKIPEASIIATQLNHEIYYHEKIDKKFGLNLKTIQMFSQMHEKLINDNLKDDEIFSNELKAIKSAFDEKIAAMKSDK